MPEFFPEHLLTTDEAADALGITKAALYRLTEEGAVQSFRVGDRTMIPGASLLAYMDKRTRDKPSRTPPASKPREVKPTRVVVTPSGTRFEVV